MTSIEEQEVAVGEMTGVSTCRLAVVQPESQLEVLRSRIQGRMKTVPQQKPYTWRSVLGCALMGTDMLWYRAQVLQVLGETVTVRGGHVRIYLYTQVHTNRINRTLTHTYITGAHYTHTDTQTQTQ